MAIGKPAKRRVGLGEAAVSLFVVVVLFGAGFYFASIPRMPTHKLLGKPVPPLTFTEVDGKQRRVEDQRGNVVLLNFWAAWCHPCLEEMPSLRMLELHFKERPFELLAFDIGEPGSDIRGTLGEQGTPSHLIFNFSKEALGPYGIRALPVSVLVDRQGIIRHVFEGAENWMSLDRIREIEELLK